VPAASQHEIHVHTVEIAVSRRTARAVFLSRGVWSGQRGLAAAANLASQAHTGC
jgi:hypothetical protein